MKTLPLDWSVDTGKVARASAVFSYEANAGELDDLRRYAGVAEMASFAAQVTLTPLSHGKFKASGRLLVSFTQASIVDLEAVPSSIEENFSVEYWPAGDIGDDSGEGLPFDADPPEAIAGDRIPLGEFLCELFAVSIDPYPRNEGDEFAWSPGHQEPDPHPFDGLIRFKRSKDPQPE